MGQSQAITGRFRPFSSQELDVISRVATELRSIHCATPEADRVTDHHILAAAEVLVLQGHLALPNGGMLRLPR